MEKIPYRFNPREYQMPLFKAFQNSVKRAAVCWHRRSGKDKACLNLLIWKLAQKEKEGVNGTYFYIFPTYAQGRKVLWDGMDKDGFKFLDHFPKELVVSVNDSEMKITTRNGSVFQVIGSDNVDSIVGTNPLGCVFSEYSIQNPKAWDYIRPILAENGGWAVFNFTPRGINHAHRLLTTAKGDGSWFWQVLTVDDTEAIPKEMLDTERKEMPDDLFRQEYFCEFQEGAGQFFKNVRKHVSVKPLPPIVSQKFILGIDLAKYHDYTVIVPIELSTLTIYSLERFNQMDYTMQEAKIRAEWGKYNKAKIRIDSTGVGEPVYDHLQSQGLTIEPFHFTEQNRKDLLMNLKILLDSGELKLPNDEQLLSELESMSYELTERGNVRITAPSGMHDDCVMALALAAWQLPKVSAQSRDPFQTYKPPQYFYDWTVDVWNNKTPRHPLI